AAWLRALVAFGLATSAAAFLVGTVVLAGHTALDRLPADPGPLAGAPRPGGSGGGVVAAGVGLWFAPLAPPAPRAGHVGRVVQLSRTPAIGRRPPDPSASMPNPTPATGPIEPSS